MLYNYGKTAQKLKTSTYTHFVEESLIHDSIVEINNKAIYLIQRKVCQVYEFHLKSRLPAKAPYLLFQKLIFLLKCYQFKYTNITFDTHQRPSVGIINKES